MWKHRHIIRSFISDSDRREKQLQMMKNTLKNENRADKRGIRGIGNVITAAVFAVVLCAFLVMSLMADDREFSENENRYLAEMPEASIASIADGSFGSGFELYAQDQLAGRDALIMLRTGGERALGRKDNGSVYFGKDGYLFAIEEINSAQLEKNIGYTEKFCAAAEERGINTKVMVVPTATEILTELLPENAPVPDETEATAKIKERLGERFIDTCDDLRAHSGEYIYYRTDHHWTTLGAYYAYRQYERETGIGETSHADTAGSAAFETPAAAGYTETAVSDIFFGTNYSKAPGIGIKPDTITRIDKAGSAANGEHGSENGASDSVKMSILNAHLECEKIFDGVYDESYLNKKDKYSYFLSGNNPVTVIEIQRDAQNAEKRNLLVIKDSYAHSFIPFLTTDFDRIAAVDMRYFRSGPGKLIEEYEITDVLVLYNILNYASDSNLVYIAH